MKATFTFELPEERAEGAEAMHAGGLLLAVQSLDNELRSMLKYDKGFGDIPDDEKKLTVQEFRDLLWDKLNEDKNVAALFE